MNEVSAFGVVHKSYVGGGVFKPVTALSGAERKTVKAGGLYRQAQGVTKPDKKFSRFYHKQIVPMTHHADESGPVGTVKVPKSALQMAGVNAMAVRAGGKNTGRSYIVRPKKLKPEILHHEMQHATPRRSAYRMEQMSRDPSKQLREEARADYLTVGHHSENEANGYSRMANLRAKAQADPTKKNKKKFKSEASYFAETRQMKTKDAQKAVGAYADLHNTLRAKGVQEGPFARSRKK